tara:strand:+ start:633 stop:905 length:273 start_codon:yes stop_codon:yes gene_type:complete
MQVYRSLSGGGGSALFYSRSANGTLTGVIDGVNDLFTLSENYKPGTIQLFVGGVCMGLLDYEEITENQIKITSDPLPQNDEEIIVIAEKI